MRPRPIAPNPSAGIATRRMSAAAVFAVLGWLFLLSMDTIFRSLIPAASLLRLAVPALLVVIACSSPRTGRRPRTAALRIALLAFIAVSSLSVATSVSPILAAVKLVLYLSVMLPLLHPGIAGLFSPDSRSLWRLSQIALAILAANLLMSFRSPGGFMTNPNQAGLLALVVAPLMLFNASRPTRKQRRLGRLGGIVCVLLVLATRSRGAMLGLLGAGFVHFVLRPGASRGPRVALALLTGSAVLGFLLTTNQSAIRSLVYKGDGQSIKDIVDAPRRLMFAEVIEAWSQRPLRAYGFGLSHRVTAESLNTVLRTGRLSWITGEMGSSTLGMLIGGGLQLVVASYAVIACILLRGYSHLADKRTTGTSKAIVRALLAGLFGLLVSAQTENWLMAPMTFATFAFWLYCGMILHAADQYGFRPKLRQRNQAENV